MTSTNIFGGFAEGSRNSSKVLKPPGGGTSDIFSANGEPELNVRRVKNHSHSNVFLSDGPSVPTTPSKSPGNSHSRLFGPPSPPKSTPRTNRSASRVIPLDVDAAPVTNGNASPLKQSPAKTSPVKPVTNGDAHDGVETPSTPNGNTSPVMNGSRLANGSGPATPTPAQPATQQQRQRVPPGGFSSGLW